jgi:hypothetical protein
MQRQQTFVASMVRKAASSEVLLDPARASDFISAILRSMRVDSGLDNGQVMALTRRLSAVNPAQVTFRTVPVIGEKPMGEIGNVVLWDKIGAGDIFTALAEDTAIPDKPSAPQVDVAPGNISVQVLGTGEAAQTALEDLDAAGYAVAPTVLPPSLDATTIEYDPGYDVSVKTLEAALPGVRTVAVAGLGSTFRLTVGTDYPGLRAVAFKDPTAPPTTRKASDDVCS